VIDGIEHIGIQVPDLADAVAFFVGVLGFEERFNGIGTDGETPVAMVASGGLEFELFQRGTEPARLEHLALRTSDLQAAGAQLAERGVAVVSDELPGMQGTRAILLDQDTTLGVRMHLSTKGPGA
jgi:catechol 2,3-dioxygenase-like lactoylglutathione lyase family enzyme